MALDLGMVAWTMSMSRTLATALVAMLLITKSTTLSLCMGHNSVLGSTERLANLLGCQKLHIGMH